MHRYDFLDTFGPLGTLCTVQWKTKSLYISLVVSSFYGTEIEIWVGFGPVGNTEKRMGVFYVFRGKKIIQSFFDNYIVCRQ